MSRVVVGGTIEQLGVGVGNFVSHEACHLFGAVHKLQSGALNIMDQGGSLPNIVGVSSVRTTYVRRI